MVHQTVESDKKINLNIHFFIIFFMICIAGLNDILIYTAHLDYSIGLIISSIINIIIFGNFIYRKKILLNSNFEKTDLILFIVWIIYSLTKIVFPDETYDTFSYHIYLQENPFIDKVNFDFFPGRIYCIFLFPLADRLHYIFRYLFGYRFGRIASFYTAIIVFYQLKNILFFLTKNKKISNLFSYSFIFVFNFIDRLCQYYIDPIGVVFLLEIFYLILTNKKNNRK